MVDGVKYCSVAELSWMKQSSAVNMEKEPAPLSVNGQLWQLPTTPFPALKPSVARAGYEAFVFNIYG